MKILAAVMALLAVIYFLPAFMSSTDKISGASQKAADKSAKLATKKWPADEKRVFDTAFFVLKDLKAGQGPGAFLESVNGLTPDEVIELAKREVNIKIATGDPAFKQYSSWEDMLRKLSETTRPAFDKSPKPEPAPLRQSERPGRPQ
jgi:hypothetical protein